MCDEILKAAEQKLEENPKNYEAFKIYALAQLLKNNEAINGSHNWENKDIAKIYNVDVCEGSCTLQCLQ